MYAKSPASRFLFVSVLVASALVGVAVLTVATVGSLAATNFWAEVPRALLTLAVGVLVTGGVAALLSAHNRAVDDRRSDHELRLQLVQQLRDVHNRVKVAALLINANKSTLVYGQQVQELLVARVSLLDVDWAVRARPRLCGGEGRSELIGALLRQAANYLDAVVEEYAGQYDRVSAIQLFSSKWDEDKAESLAKAPGPPEPAQMTTSGVPWRELTRPEALRRSRDPNSAKPRPSIAPTWRRVARAVRQKAAFTRVRRRP